MLNYRLGTVNDFHWKFKPVLSYSKFKKPQRQVISTTAILNHEMKI